MQGGREMLRNGFFWALLIGLSVFAPGMPTEEAQAQEVQRVTITVDEASDGKLTFEPKEVTVKPGKVEFTLVNKGKANHNLVLKQNDKEVRLARATPGQSEKAQAVDVAAGEYELYCSFTSGGNHKERGMAGKLIVK
jgi:plastocyanin